jgi:hypothetical protein
MILNIFMSESVLMPLTYHSGEEIKPGDIVMFHGEPGEIEFVADPLADNIDPEISWHVQEFGGGVGVIEPKHFGRAFVVVRFVYPVNRVGFRVKWCPLKPQRTPVRHITP